MIDTGNVGLITPDGQRVVGIEPKKENPNIIQDLGIEVFNGKMIVRQKAIQSSMIFLPDGAKKEFEKSEGVVLAVSPEVKDRIPIEVGDYIAWGKYASALLAEGEEENLHIVDCGDVLYKKNKPNTEDTNV